MGHLEIEKLKKENKVEKIWGEEKRRGRKKEQVGQGRKMKKKGR